MPPKLIVTSTKTPVLKIAKQMATQRKNCIVICNESDNKNHKPVGIITKRDIVKIQDFRLNFSSTNACAVINFSLIPLQVKSTFGQAHQFMQQHRIRRLVAVNEAESLAQIVSQSTLLQVLDSV